MKFSKLKLILPTLGDFANGVFAVSASAWLFGVDLVWWHFIIAFVIALLPDIDALPELFQYGQVGQKRESTSLDTNHRTYMHYPAVYIVIGLLIFKWSPFWGLVFLLGTLLHFLRDMLGTGWGVKALWPVSDKSYRFFSHGNDTFQVTSALTDQETTEFAHTHGNSNWLDETYLRLSWISGIEYLLFVISVGIMLLHLLY